MSKKSFFSKVAAILFFLAAAHAWTYTYTWAGGADGNWENASNWTSSDGGTGYPGAGDTVRVQSNSTIHLGSSVSVDSMFLGSMGKDYSITLDLEGHSLDVTNMFSLGETGIGGDPTNVNVTLTDGSVNLYNLDFANDGIDELILNGVELKITGTYYIDGAAGARIISTNGTGNVIDVSGATAFSDSGATIINIIPPTSDVTVVGVGDDFTWTGAFDSDWSNAANWSGSAVPDSAAVVVIPAGRTIYPVLSADAEAGKITVKSGASLGCGNKSLTITLSLQNDGAITADSGTISAEDYSGSGSFTGGSSNLTLTGDFTNTGTFTGGSVIFAGSSAQTLTNSGSATFGNFTVNSGASVSTSSSFNVSGNFTNGENFSASGGRIKMTGTGVAFAGGGGTFNSFEYAPSASSSSIEVTGANTFADFSCTVASSSVTISDSNTIASFEMTSPGGTLTLNAEQAVSSSLTLAGATSGNLTVKGSSGGFSFADSVSRSAAYLNISRNSKNDSSSDPQINSASGDIYFVAENSKFDYTILYGEYNNWIVLNPDMTFTWTGDSSSDWGEASNWDIGLVPGLASTFAGLSTSGYAVLIPDSVTSGNWPEILSSDSASYSVKSLSVGEGARTSELTISNSSGLTVSGGLGRLTNFGTISYSSSGRITDGSSFINDTGNSGSVKYTGGTNLILSTQGGDDYANLIIDSTAAISSGSEVTVSSKAEISGTVSGVTSLSVAGEAEINADVTTSGAQTYSDKITGTSFNLTASIIELNGGSVETSGNQLYSGKVTSSGDISFEGLAAGSKIIFNGSSVETSGIQLYLSDVEVVTDCSFSGTAIQLAKSFVTVVSATLTADTYIYGSAPASIGGGSGSITISADLHIAAAPSKAITISSLLSARNFILYSGSVTANADISSAQDVVLFGPAYSADDTATDSPSGVAGLFAYDNSGRKKAASATLVSSLPSSTGTFATNGGSMTVSDGKTLTAGANFYANGITISSSGAWNLSIPDNDAQTSAFAEIYYTTISNCLASHYVMAAEGNTVSSCTNFDSLRPLVNEAYTVYDNVIYVSFKDADGNDATIENSCGEIAAAFDNITYSGGSFTGAYKDLACTIPVSTGDVTGGFYILADSYWNTDATGASAGDSDSTNRSGVHYTNIPYLNIPKALSSIYETLRDNHKNRIRHYDGSNKISTVEDKCQPVLTAVFTGQEEHNSSASSQYEYDAHNFIEFRYSEPVTISGGTTTVGESDVNVQAATDLGETNSSSPLTVAGLASFSSGYVSAGISTGSGSPHALYRNFSDSSGDSPVNHKCRVRLSIAGYVDGTVDGSHKKWVGYISGAARPSGLATPLANPNLVDLAGNSLDTGVNATISSHASFPGWDVTPPSFAPLRMSGIDSWTSNPDHNEAIGSVSVGTTVLEGIELHFFDNAPTYSGDQYEWFSKIGWAENSGGDIAGPVKWETADAIGGSRSNLTSSASKTEGGIRYSSLYDSGSAFSYLSDSGNVGTFNSSVTAGASSSLFAVNSGGGNSMTAEDGLYCMLHFPSASFPAATTFTLTLSGSSTYITDLAGNRMSSTYTIHTVDRTPPSLVFSLAPVGQKKLLLVTSKPLNTSTIRMFSSAGTYTLVDALSVLPSAITIDDGSEIEIDTAVPARVVFKNKKATGLLFTLKKPVDLAAITGNKYIEVAASPYTYDPLTGMTTAVSYIQDSIGNFIEVGKDHAFSDFAVNAVQPDYAYDLSMMEEDGTSIFQNLYQDGSWAVHDWSENQGNYGTLVFGYDLFFHARLFDGTSDNSGGLVTSNINMILDDSPDSASVSKTFNDTAGLSWRIWLPNITSEIFKTISPVNNSDFIKFPGGILLDSNAAENPQYMTFTLPVTSDASYSSWKAGSHVQFLFQLADYTVKHEGKNGDEYPLYCLRLDDENDILSLDLWSFNLKSIKNQRGGVTILNNVIDLNKSENVVVKVDVPEDGNLNVYVMTLDGNIVTRLAHGRTTQGTHYYRWNGRNQKDKPVARGLYFIRVSGPDIDETRKVMCVK